MMTGGWICVAMVRVVVMSIIWFRAGKQQHGQGRMAVGHPARRHRPGPDLALKLGGAVELGARGGDVG